MKREFLEGLGLEKEVVDKIMKEHGITVQSIKPDDYEDLKSKVKNHDQVVQELNNKLASKDDEYKGFEAKETEYLSKISNYEKKELKYRVARENDIPFSLAERLSGETEEEMIADAKALSKFVSGNDLLPLKNEVSNKKDAYEEMVDGL